jgi:carbon-monoxide dehydrogenase medium subunit
MKPPVFRYVAARSVKEALDQLGRSDGEGKVLAGGQSLTPMLNFRLARPSLLVDINRVPGLDEIQKDDGGLVIGALARHRAIETSAIVRERFPILTAAAEQIGHLAIRNRGTFGGSLAHADPAAEWPMLALLLDAELRSARPSGARKIAARDFFVSVMTTALDPDEILTEVRLPGTPPHTGWGFEELSRRHGDFAIAAVAALVTLDKGVCKEARISLGGVAGTPVRATAAEAALRGQRLDEGVVRQAADRAKDDADPSGDVHGSADYRRHLITVLARRAITRAAERAAQA